MLGGTYALGRARRQDSEADRAERDVKLTLTWTAMDGALAAAMQHGARIDRTAPPLAAAA